MKDHPSNPTKDLTLRQVFSVSKIRRFPSWKQWKQLSGVLSSFEKRVVQTASVLITASLVTITAMFLFAHRVEIPARGGEYTEALIGEPRLINPLYASTNDADQDLTTLVYSGLLKWNPDQGFVPDLAQSVEINEEKTVYAFTIKENARFHNGDSVLARDVIFTINAIQNPTYRSPLLPRFKSVSVVQEDDRKISFVLEKPNAQFQEYLTVGILPSNAWADILPQNAPLAALNLQPIGSGPYRFSEFTKDKKGSLRTYTLESFDDFVDGEPLIERLNFKFYPDVASAMDALENKFVEGVSVVPFESKEQTGQNRAVALHSALLSREVVLYFNQKTNPQLQKKAVREAIAYAIDKEQIVAEKLSGAGAIIGHILPDATGFSDELPKRNLDIQKARELISKTLAESVPSSEQTPAKQPNKLTLTTIAAPEFIYVAQMLKAQLEQTGLEVEILTVQADTFFDEVIVPRNFELLLTTVMFNAQPDPYLFWHSSQKEAGGLNIADYQNTEVDALLEKARVTSDEQQREQLLKSFQEKLLEDLPAVFLYQSTYGYATSKKVHGVQLTSVRVPSDRFIGIEKWFIRTKKAFQ